MCVERIVRLVAGTFVLVFAALTHWVSPWFALGLAFVGLNLAQSALTRWCLLASILRARGVPPCEQCGSVAWRSAPWPLD